LAALFLLLLHAASAIIWADVTNSVLFVVLAGPNVRPKTWLGSLPQPAVSIRLGFGRIRLLSVGYRPCLRFSLADNDLPARLAPKDFWLWCCDVCLDSQLWIAEGGQHPSRSTPTSHVHQNCAMGTLHCSINLVCVRETVSYKCGPSQLITKRFREASYRRKGCQIHAVR